MEKSEKVGIRRGEDRLSALCYWQTNRRTDDMAAMGRQDGEVIPSRCYVVAHHLCEERGDAGGEGVGVLPASCQQDPARRM